MLQGGFIFLIALLYIGLLFAIATYGDRRAEQGRSIISSPYIYALSLAVYCTAWTFYGSVGRAASSGVGYLPIYLGPTLTAVLWWMVLRKMIRISKVYRITSIADFVASRYGKSSGLAALVTVIAVTGGVPYIALQLKAISVSFQVLSGRPTPTPTESLLDDTALYVTLALALFSILFGTRHLDATERHEGLVAAIAFESLVKLPAFVAVGLFVTFGLYDGPADLFGRALARPEFRRLLTMEEALGPGAYGQWFWMTLLAMLAILFLPRQFQVAVVENVDERHLRKAIWLFPLYLWLINLFVLPIALAGLMAFPGGQVDADMFVLAIPLAHGQELLALLAFIGGFSAATSMVIVATVALSTMISNDLIMPILLRIRFLRLAQRGRLTGLLLGIRRGGIVLVLLLSYLYFHAIAHAYALVSIGLISFAAVAQFAPAILGGMYWRRGTRAGALCGLIAGFLIWGYTLPLPSLVDAGLLPVSFIENGPWGVGWLRPYQLFGLEGFDPISHALFWSLLFNAGLYVGVSLFTQQRVEELLQARAFVDVFRLSGRPGEATWRGTAYVSDLQQLLRRFLGKKQADEALRPVLAQGGGTVTATAEVVQHAERLLAGAIGSASARVLIASVVKEEPLSLREVMDILDETQQVIAYSHELERKSAELERATRELQAANERLKELDRLKDEFISTITHELRTPLTSIRAFSEIMHANPNLPEAQRQEFLGIIIKEAERLTRLINQVLTLQKLESGTVELNLEPVRMQEVIEEAVEAIQPHVQFNEITLTVSVPETPCYVLGDRDQLVQVLLNLLSNAVKFCNPEDGRIAVRLLVEPDRVRVDVEDNGPGIAPEDQATIFDKFRQVHTSTGRRPPGTGLGLAIAQRIVQHHHGRIWVESDPGHGATFSFTLPRLPASDGMPQPMRDTSRLNL
ncbi:sensor histidine kinase [Rhodothermus marinus]|uniref:sensor histidine kinase n=1 Tax=Rhodothermus marinus TaxID=29549 RepID=UPI0012BA3E59|nr:sensor histidine kinase [Rhodothermus marinus]BBM69817.1 sodium:solute symporter [Rhodothermus marinus]BBM72803.1 sodium:solute symporter [Rhodothermus marinus]